MKVIRRKSVHHVISPTREAVFSYDSHDELTPANLATLQRELDMNSGPVAKPAMIWLIIHRTR